MAVSYNDAIETLSAMFSEWDKETLGAFLRSNGNVKQTYAISQ